MIDLLCKAETDQACMAGIAQHYKAGKAEADTVEDSSCLLCF